MVQSSAASSIRVGPEFSLTELRPVTRFTPWRSPWAPSFSSGFETAWVLMRWLDDYALSVVLAQGAGPLVVRSLPACPGPARAGASPYPGATGKPAHALIARHQLPAGKSVGRRRP